VLSPLALGSSKPWTVAASQFGGVQTGTDTHVQFRETSLPLSQAEMLFAATNWLLDIFGRWALIPYGVQDDCHQTTSGSSSARASVLSGSRE
jgi:hypothetical protein